jgi:DNA-binding CsgD family transcriptional regulator
MHIEGISAETQIEVLVTAKKEHRPPSTILLERLVQEHPELSDPVPPHVAHYHADAGYLGTLLILGANSDLQGDTNLRRLAATQEFFRAKFLDCIRSIQLRDPIALLYRNRIADIVQKCALTHRKFEVLVYHIFGESYSDIGTFLHISPNTVRTHVNAIHRKTGSRSLLDLLINYFGPGGIRIRRPR